MNIGTIEQEGDAPTPVGFDKSRDRAAQLYVLRTAAGWSKAQTQARGWAVQENLVSKHNIGAKVQLRRHWVLGVAQVPMTGP